MLCVCLLALSLLVSAAEEKKSSETDKEGSEGLHETVVVTASRLEQPIVEAVSLVTVISSRDLVESPRLVLDDQLRQVPGLNLFRRSSSLAAHPTSQGVSLRGIGPSGTSRSLVLFDGIPLNDPFGGWIYWNRIPILSLRGVEVVRGATSPLYGSSALGGTIQLLARRPSPDTLEVRGQLGSGESYDLEVFASDAAGDWGYVASGRLFHSDGFFIVDESLRGAVDVPAGSEFQTFFGRFYHRGFHVGVNVFGEKRRNGTRIQKNSSRIALVEAGLQGDSWSLDFYSQSERFRSTFSRILPDRSAEFLTAEQEFPSMGLGSSLTYRLGSQLLLGTDWRYVRWEDKDQNLLGVFAQELFSVHPRLDLLLGARFDVWQNRKTQTAVNPRAGLLFRTADSLTLRASAYRGFRAPTLNELYRPFRVGNIRTLANPDLEEETLWGGEVGADFHPTGSLLLRANTFWNMLGNAVTNATLSTSTELILRQRQNIGRARIRGLEIEAIILSGEKWRLQTGYLYSDATARESRLRLPQVPLHQGSIGVSYKGALTWTGQARWVGGQFEDDRNALELEGYGLFDVMVRRRVAEHFELFFSFENVLNRAYPVGRTPVEKLGAPRLFHGGLHFRFGQ